MYQLWRDVLAGGYPSGRCQGPTLLGKHRSQGDLRDLPAHRGYSHVHGAQGSLGCELPSISSPHPRVFHPTGSSASQTASSQGGDREGSQEAPSASKEAWGNAGSGEHLG